MDFFSRRRLGISLVVLFGLSAIAMAADAFPPLVNWSAPVTYTPARTSGARALGDITFMLPFVGIAPCRQFDIRPATLADNTPIPITVTGAPCGISPDAQAVSLNITVFSISGAGGNGVFTVGTANPPVTAWINYPSTETQRGNAGALPVDGSGQIWVEVNQGGGSIQLTVDVNGYYTTIPASSGNYFRIESVVGGGFGAIVGQNDSTATSAVGVLGQIASSTPGSGSAGVQGINFGTTGEGAGVSGIHTGDGYGVWGEALGTTGGGGNQRGVFGIARSNANYTAGVFGSSVASTGKVYGVLGFGTSTTADSAGVLGVDGTGFPAGPLSNEPSGVDGYSKLGVAVNGVSQNAGVRGELYDSAGNFLQLGILGISTYGVFSTGDYGGTGAKYFVEPHATDPGKVVRYVSLEGNESGTYFRGSAQIANGMAVILVPEDFRMVTDESALTVQLTPVGASAMMYVEKEDLNYIVVRSNRDVKFHYMVNGIRRAFKNFTPIAQEAGEFMPYSAAAAPLSSYPAEIQQRLIANGTYNADGSVNMETARRLGWDKLKTARQPVSGAPTSQQE